MNKIGRPYLLLFLITTLLLPVYAHHSFFTFYYMDKTIEIEGVVTSLKLVNPHSEMIVEVTNKDGTKTPWHVLATSGGTANLRKGGWQTGMLVGTRVKVEGHPPRKEGGNAMAAGKVTLMENAKLPDGKEVPAGSEFWLGGGGNVPSG